MKNIFFGINMSAAREVTFLVKQCNIMDGDGVPKTERECTEIAMGA